MQFTGESQIREIEDKFSLPYNQSLLSSTQNSMESLATPREAYLDDEQIRILLASPRYLPEREANAERSQICHSGGDGLLSSSFQSLNFMGMALTSEKIESRLANDSVFRDSNPANVAKSLLEGNRGHLLTQARTALMKQEHKVESLSNFIIELQ